MLRKLHDWIRGWITTYRIMRNPDLMASIRKAHEDAQQGRLLTYKEIFDECAEEDKELAEQGMDSWNEELKRIDNEN